MGSTEDDEPILKLTASGKRKRGAQSGARPGAMSKRAKQDARLPKDTLPFRPYPKATTKDFGVFGSKTTPDAEVWDPVVGPVFRAVADAAVLASARADVTHGTINAWLTNQFRRIAETVKVEGSNADREPVALLLAQIAEPNGSSETKLNLVKSLRAWGAKTPIVPDIAHRAAAEHAPSCISVLVDRAKAGEPRPLSLFMRWLIIIGDKRKDSFLDYMDKAQSDRLRKVLETTRGMKAASLGEQLLDMMEPFASGRQRSSGDNGETVDTMASASASVSMADSTKIEKDESGTNGAERDESRPHRIPRRPPASLPTAGGDVSRRASEPPTASASFSDPRVSRRDPVLPLLATEQRRLSAPSEPYSQHFQLPLSQPARPVTQPAQSPQSAQIAESARVGQPGQASLPAQVSQPPSSPLTLHGQQVSRAVPELAHHPASQSAVAAAVAYPGIGGTAGQQRHPYGLPPSEHPNTSYGSLEVSAQTYQQRAAQERILRPSSGGPSGSFDFGMMPSNLTPNGASVAHPPTITQPPAALPAPAVHPDTLRQRLPTAGSLPKRSYDAYASSSSGILKPERCVARDPTKSVSFRETAHYPPRTYLQEASQVFEAPTQNEVMHLFWDSGDPLDWGPKQNPRFVEEVKENMVSGKIHSIMALHALLVAQIERLQAQQQGREWNEPKMLQVVYPDRRRG